MAGGFGDAQGDQGSPAVVCVCVGRGGGRPQAAVTHPLPPNSLPQTVSIVSYNHLGNNDGKNLSAPQQFRSKEASKSNVVDDMVQSNPLLYGPQEKPDHCVSAGGGAVSGAGGSPPRVPPGSVVGGRRCPKPPPGGGSGARTKVALGCRW